LQSKVSQLRRALGDKQLVVGEAHTYRLNVEPSSVNAARAVDLAREATAAQDAGDGRTALDKASEGLPLFRGEVLLEEGDWAAPYRARLEEVRMGLLEDMMAARVDLGSGGELVAELEALVAQHPLRERLWASLMTALYRGGRQADALAAYTRLRTLLIDELGVEPGPNSAHSSNSCSSRAPTSWGTAPSRDQSPLPETSRATSARCSAVAATWRRCASSPEPIGW
jgi:DNA-binding SARP family transcriptional activator